MAGLCELQRKFSAALLAGRQAADDILALVAAPRDGAAGVDAYRQSVMGNLTAALASTYPVVERIVGQPFFRAAARRYALTWPSRSGDLNEYGDGFADFLSAYPHAAALPYLPDVARLEWCVQTVYYAASAVNSDFGGLAGVEPARYADLRFEPMPAHARLDSPWPLARIWEVNRFEAGEDMAVDFSAGCHCLVWRRDGRVRVDSLDAGEAALFDSLAGGNALDEALQAALAAEPRFDLALALRKLLARGVFSEISCPDMG